MKIDHYKNDELTKMKAVSDVTSNDKSANVVQNLQVEVIIILFYHSLLLYTLLNFSMFI